MSPERAGEGPGVVTVFCGVANEVWGSWDRNLRMPSSVWIFFSKAAAALADMTVGSGSAYCWAR